MSKLYFVSGSFICSGYVVADSFEDAAEKFISQCDGDAEGEFCVTDTDTCEEKMCQKRRNKNDYFRNVIHPYWIHPSPYCSCS